MGALRQAGYDTLAYNKISDGGELQMDCGLGSPEQISACLHLVSRWFGVAANVVGLGTFALIALLVWLFRRLRKDLSKWEDDAKRATELKVLAEEAAKHAQHRVELAEREAARDKKALEESLIDFVFEEELDANWPKLAVRRVAENLHYIPAFYNFELVERRVEYRWALGTTGDDVRYRLARALLSESVQSKFDRVLIDAPPRFTLGFVNGFCAATHLYVPTVVDVLSASAVGTFAQQFRELRAIVNPRIQWAGIIGTMSFINPRDTLSLAGRAQRVADIAERAAQNQLDTKEPLFIRKPVIVRDADLARATEKGVAYLNDSNMRPMFDALATVIESKAPSRKTRA